MNLDCIHCFQRQALQATSYISCDEDLQEHVLREVMKKLLELKWDSKPMEIANEVHKIVRKLTKVKDPYKRVKRECNDLVLRLYPKLRAMVNESKDPLRTAVRLAIAGNIIDFGALRKFDLEKIIGEVTDRKFAIEDYEMLRWKLKEAKSILFFADNAGEIGFDRLLLETMMKETIFKRISFVVKGGVIINDATLEDALYMGLDKLLDIRFLTVSNGEVGTGSKIDSQEVRGWLGAHDLVISKGQGNYEGLSEFNGLFFALIVKCPIIASDLGLNVKDFVFKYRP